MLTECTRMGSAHGFAHASAHKVPTVWVFSAHGVGIKAETRWYD